MRERTRPRTGSRRLWPEGRAWRRARPWLAASVVAVIVLSVYLAMTVPKDGPSSVPGQEEFDYGDTIIKGPLQYAPTYNPCTQDYRPDYGAECATLQKTFGQLPGVPADMVDVSERVFKNSQGFVTLSRIPASYWKNPEFYPGWSQVHFEEVYVKDRGDIVTPIGFGAYPSITQVVTKENAERWTFTFFLKDGWGITHWQGMVLEIELPEVALKANFREPLLDGNGQPVTQDVSLAAAMKPTFTIENDPVYEGFVNELLLPIDAGNRMVVLEPNYPSFRPDWVKAITLEVDLNGLQKGTWFFLVRARTPSPEIGELYFYEYGQFYQPSGFDIVLFEGIIVVV